MISIRKLCKAFTVAEGKVAALKSLDLEVAEGDFFVIVGASGSGKTTPLRCGGGARAPRRAGALAAAPPPPFPPGARRLRCFFSSSRRRPPSSLLGARRPPAGVE